MKRTRALPSIVTYLLLFPFILIAAPISPAQQTNQEVTPAVQQLYTQAKAAQANGDDATAIEKYRAMIRLAPHLAAAYNNLGMLYFNQHDFMHAAQVLEHGLKLNPNMPSASAMLGMSYFGIGKYENAEPLLKSALRTNPNDDSLEMMLAQDLINLKKYEDATRQLNHFLGRNPKDQQAWYLLGKTYLQMSEDALAKINQIDPNSFVAHEIAGEIDESMKNYDGALVEYNKAVSIAPKQPGTHLHMANVYWVIGKWESAQTEFKAELENNPNDCVARWKLANSMLEANGSSEEALSELNQSIDRCPTLMQAKVDRARALIRLQRQNEALPDLLEAAKDSPNEPSIHFFLASVYKAQGKSAEAQQELHTYGRLQREASEAVAGQANEAISLKSKSH